MAKRTYLQLCTVVHRECGISGSAPSAVTNQSGILDDLVNWVAEAAYEIEAFHGDWDFHWSQWSESTVASTAVYTAPSDLGEWDRDSFYLNYTADTYQKLRALGYKEWRKRYRQGTQTNDKSTLVVIQPDNSVRLWPVPDAVYTLTADYWSKPTRLAANGDYSAVPEDFERAIIELAKMKYATDQGAPQIMGDSEVEYERWFNQLEASQWDGQKHRRIAHTADLVVRPV